MYLLITLRAIWYVSSFPSAGSGITENLRQFFREYCSRSSILWWSSDISDFIRSNFGISDFVIKFFIAVLLRIENKSCYFLEGFRIWTSSLQYCAQLWNTGIRIPISRRIGSVAFIRILLITGIWFVWVRKLVVLLSILEPVLILMVRHDAEFITRTQYTCNVNAKCFSNVSRRLWSRWILLRGIAKEKLKKKISKFTENTHRFECPGGTIKWLITHNTFTK